MVVSISVKVKRRGDASKWLAGFERRMQGPHAVKVGFPQGSDVSVVEYAIYNHFGTSGRTPRRGGWGGPIPSRPFITAACFKHEAEIRQMLAAAYKAILEGRITAEAALERIALYGVGIIQATIAAGMAPANSELTIKLKGTGKNTLNDEGRMRGSVHWAFDGSTAPSAGRAGRRSITGK